MNTEPGLDNRIWFKQWVHPLINAMVAGDGVAAAAAEQAIHGALARGEFDSDTAAALKYTLGYHLYLQAVLLQQTEGLPAILDQALAILAQPPVGPISAHEQRCLVLQLRIIADDMGTRALPRPEFNDLLAAIPPARFTTGQYFYISKYTFKQHDIVGTAAIYERYLEHNSCWAREYVWRRLEVMVKLLEERATRLDLELLIKALIVPGCFTEMNNVILPEARRQGLVDEGLEALLRQRREDIAAALSTAETAVQLTATNHHSG